MKILVVGDVVGESGLEKLKVELRKIKETENIDFIVVNAENVAGGMGITVNNFNELKKLNIQIIMENLNTWYFEFLFIFCFILCLVFKFINFNIHFILFLLCLVILIPSFINFLKIYKHKNLFFIILGIFYIFSLVPINLYLNSTFIPILLLFPFFILEFAILCQKMYNQAKEKKK